MSRTVVHRVAALVVLLALRAHPTSAQTSTGNVRGYVTGSNGSAISDVQVAARATDNNATRGTVTNASGYYFLGGLRPTTYEITVRRVGFTPVTRTIRLQIGQTLDLDLTIADQAVQLSAFTVTAANAGAVETKSTEVATNVTQAQVNDLPTASRNFLDLAQLAPGTTITPDRMNGTGKTFAAGAQSADQINVFVDGASYKNEIITGGVAGQDASRGNPFPRNAIQELRVITNNFRPEYQKASSAIITAATKSGTNDWHGSAFVDLQNENFVAQDTFTLANPAHPPKPDYKRYLLGLSMGGPIQHDRWFFFGSYEGNLQDREGLTTFGSTAPSRTQPFNNTLNTSPFRSHLLFGKVNYVPGTKQELEFSGDFRHEVDTRGFGGQFGDTWRAYSGGEDHRNNVYTGRAKHTLYSGAWTNEALVSYQYYLWNQDPIDFATPVQVAYGNFWIGGNDAAQHLTQNRLSLRDDWTFTGWHWQGDHGVKIGANFDFTRYGMNKQLNENPTYVYDSRNNFQTPIQAIYGVGNGDITQNNNQLGAYAQDTWNPSRRLTIDYGLRWDMETGMYNRDYVTPKNVRDSVTAYASKLYVPIDPSRYFTDGSQRKLFYGGFQPRIGASYQLDTQGHTTVFTSAGIFYDRLPFNATLDETYRRQHPIYRINFSATGGNGTFKWDTSYITRAGLNGIINSATPPATEVFLIPNDLRPPRSSQWSVGLRQIIKDVTTSLTYNGTRSKNGFSYEWANVAYNPATNDCCITANLPAYQNVLVANNDVRTWYDALLVQVDRPYRRIGEFGWGAGLAYTLGKADQEGNDLFSFPQVRAYGNTRHPTAADRRHTVVLNYITDVPYLWGIQFSGITQIASGVPFNKTQFVPIVGGGNQRQFLDRSRGPWYHNWDMRLFKGFVNAGGQRAGVTASLFNVFNTQNLGCFNETFANPGSTPGSTVPNPDYGKASCTISDPRRFQLGLTYDF